MYSELNEQTLHLANKFAQIVSRITCEIKSIERLKAEAEKNKDKKRIYILKIASTKVYTPEILKKYMDKINNLFMEKLKSQYVKIVKEIYDEKIKRYIYVVQIFGITYDPIRGNFILFCFDAHENNAILLKLNEEELKRLQYEYISADVFDTIKEMYKYVPNQYQYYVKYTSYSEIMNILDKLHEKKYITKSLKEKIIKTGIFNHMSNSDTLQSDPKFFILNINKLIKYKDDVKNFMKNFFDIFSTQYTIKEDPVIYQCIENIDELPKYKKGMEF